MKEIMKKTESADVTRRRDRDWSWGFDPFRTMREFMRWDPFRNLDLAPVERGFFPDVEVKETKDALLFHIDLPGVREDDVDISLTDSQLRISGERREERKEEQGTYYTN